MKQTQWQLHVEAFNKSGLSKREYVETHQLIYHQFLYWSQKLNKAAPEAFVPVTVTPPAVSTKLKPKPVTKPMITTSLGVLEFPNGIRLIIQSHELLAQLPTLLSKVQDQELGHAITL
ncbi:MAG: hypothetical protein GY712_10095 [Oceanicoccus sp.]|uniref:IS66 family insertion sequence element accessory protein TnpA n=1 Tax=Oceanicoccus sp. TaxID=2691044 RepID=UPI00261B3854|nr:hypothetical protein [Oceanicoccus sp.]MCP3908351.1 hypothetical protein [Oceanicoccus sp.]